MRFLFFLPFLLFLIWSYAAMFESLDIKPKIFRPIAIVTGIGAFVGLITILAIFFIGFYL